MLKIEIISNIFFKPKIKLLLLLQRAVPLSTLKNHTRNFAFHFISFNILDVLGSTRLSSKTAWHFAHFARENAGTYF